MTTPNIKTAATFTAHNAVADAGTTYAAIVSNASTSNALQKVSTVTICNITAATSCGVSVAVSNGTSYFHLLAGLAVTASITPVTRETPIYLGEGDSLCIHAQTAGHIQVIVGYETVQ